jgi:hypothetical protein
MSGSSNIWKSYTVVSQQINQRIFSSMCSKQCAFAISDAQENPAKQTLAAADPKTQLTERRYPSDMEQDGAKYRIMITFSDRIYVICQTRFSDLFNHFLSRGPKVFPDEVQKNVLL